jgi:cytochrome P450
MTTGETQRVAFNPFEPGFFDNPYAQYRVLRERDPVHHSELGFWVLFRYPDVVRVLRDPAMSVEEGNAMATVGGPASELFAQLAAERPVSQERSMLGLDPPDHTRLRRLVTKAFTPRVLDALRPRVEQLVDEALDAAASRGEMDVIADLAFPLPFTVISEMLGLPESNRLQLRGWSHAMVKTLDPIITPDELRAAFEAGEQMIGHLVEVMAWKRANPGDDLLSALIAAEEDGDVLSEEELIAQVTLLYIAGHETTVNLIGNGTLALLRHPAQMESLRSDPSLGANAVEELLRYDSPVQFSRRITLAPLEIDGAVIEPGSFVLTGLGSANHDPAEWGEDADELDIGRDGAMHHQSFGGGAHYCLGAALARLEGQVAVGRLVSRFPGLRLLTEEPEWNGRIVLRGLDRLPVALGAPG